MAMRFYFRISFQHTNFLQNNHSIELKQGDKIMQICSTNLEEIKLIIIVTFLTIEREVLMDLALHHNYNYKN